jgi:type II secretory pathway pseudopilin PulG|tara:strand:- start:22 stop:837 length:816 start_codon:yes stop_codon:yes gene_type:complete
MNESKFQYIDEEKEMSGEEYSDSEVEESPNNEETEVEAESTDTPETEELKLQIGEQTFESVDELLKFAEERDKSYTNLQSLNGKQTNELGDLRKTVEELKTALTPQEEPQVEPEFDEYDPAKQKEYIEFMAAKKAQDMIDQRFQAEEAKKAEEEYNSAMDAMMSDFITKHPELDKASLEKIAAFGDERGITFIEDAYNVWNIQNQPVKDSANTEIDKAKKATEATKIPTTLSNVSTGNESETDYDNLSPEQWANLSPEVRKKALMEVNSGF